MDAIDINPTQTILTPRLELAPMTAEFLQASLEARRPGGSPALAADLLGMVLSPEWLDHQALMSIRLEQMQKDPAAQRWLLRAIGLRAGRLMAGHIGFHTPPAPEYLQEISPGAIEIGYTVYTPYRRQGIATEACSALIDWAYKEHGVRRFILTINPENTPSIRIAHRLGFQRIGLHLDPEDGPEDIYELDYHAIQNKGASVI